MDAALQNAVVFNEETFHFEYGLKNVIIEQDFRFERGIDKND